MLRMIRFWVCVAWMGCCCTASARSKWLYSKSQHFEFFTSAPEWEARKMLGELEEFRATFLAMFHLRRDREPRATVVLFDSDREFSLYKPLFNGKPVPAAGYFTGAADEAVIGLVSGMDAEQTREVIFHEYVHMLLHSRDIRVPPWLNEGLAEMYSTFEIDRESIKFGRPKPYHLQLLSGTSLMPLSSLFAVSQSSHTYNGGPEQGVFYAESWALVHFLLCGQDQSNREKLVQFMSNLDAEGTNPEVAFRAAFAMSYDQMERQLRSYMRSGTYLLRSAKVTLPDYEKSLVFRPATDFERDVALENLRFRMRQSPDSEYKLLQLSEREPTSPRPHEILAAISMFGKETSLARDRWRRAAELGSDNPFVYVQLAMDVVRQFMTVISLGDRFPPAQCDQLRTWLDRAIELSPDYLQAYETLATVEAFSPKPRPAAVNRIQASVGQMRDSNRTLISLAVVRWRVGDVATSESILAALEKRTDLPKPVASLAEKLKRRISADQAKKAALENEKSAAAATQPALAK